MDAKSSFQQRHKNVVKQANSSEKMIYLRAYFDMKQTSIEFFGQKCECQRCI